MSSRKHTARRLILASLLSFILCAGITTARNDVGLALDDVEKHGHGLKGATPSGAPADKDGRMKVQCNNGNGKGNGKTPPCPTSASDYLTTLGSTSTFPYLATCAHRVSCGNAPLQLVVSSAASNSMCFTITRRSIARSDLGWCPTATCMNMLDGLAEVRLHTAGDGPCAPTSATLNGVAVPITHPSSSSSSLVISLASLTAADIAADHATLCLATSCAPSASMMGFQRDLPYYMAGAGSLISTRTVAAGVYMDQYEVKVEYALIGAGQACCTESCQAGFTVERERCDITNDPTANRCTTGSVYSSCANSISNADCVAACTVGCRLTLSSLSSFASKNPTGCCRCITNINGWCGCGRTVNYCCAA
ncbi:hypothetical protein HYH02_008017 [Chlamydomonas schloesseri]|uniref:Uncharacterized protein n=1 Tax=Chlamydomonas schloesseri TaxID=2026947 RepID=A0A835WG72_9CHLO|nr:hypothetical protein HYH02_008017 [Chlamydomonas schloesseri]|eukprot:KAG2446860.1 hypothetical protein HYH02_008017 [Chlamydomonas schloesseri]